MAWDGTNLWLGDGNTDLIYKMDPSTGADQALQLFNEALELSPDSALIHFHKARTLLRMGNKFEALGELKEAKKTPVTPTRFPASPSTLSSRNWRRGMMKSRKQQNEDFKDIFR